MIESASEFVTVRGLRVHVRRWGPPMSDDVPTLFALHGWMDVAASFQFVANALVPRWRVIAPDARGFGLTDWPVLAQGGGHYWFADYIADLDVLLDHYSPQRPVNLVGHSMGANVVCLYAGVRPERVRHVVSLEGFGPAARPGDAPQRWRRWLDDVREPPTMRACASLDAVAQRLMHNNARLAPERAAFLARHWSQPMEGGGYRILGDPAHKMRSPQPYRLDEAMALWAQVRAPVLHVEASDSATLKRLAGESELDEFRARFAAFPDWRSVSVDDAGHMLHHDQPERIAALIDAFCAASQKTLE